MPKWTAAIVVLFCLLSWTQPGFAVNRRTLQLWFEEPQHEPNISFGAAIDILSTESLVGYVVGQMRSPSVEKARLAVRILTRAIRHDNPPDFNASQFRPVGDLPTGILMALPQVIRPYLKNVGSPFVEDFVQLLYVAHDPEAIHFLAEELVAIAERLPAQSRTVDSIFELFAMTYSLEGFSTPLEVYQLMKQKKESGATNLDVEAFFIDMEIEKHPPLLACANNFQMKQPPSKAVH